MRWLWASFCVGLLPIYVPMYETCVTIRLPACVRSYLCNVLYYIILYITCTSSSIQWCPFFTTVFYLLILA